MDSQHVIPAASGTQGRAKVTFQLYCLEAAEAKWVKLHPACQLPLLVRCLH